MTNSDDANGSWVRMMGDSDLGDLLWLIDYVANEAEGGVLDADECVVQAAQRLINRLNSELPDDLPDIKEWLAKQAIRMTRTRVAVP